MELEQFPHRIIIISEGNELGREFDIFSGSLEATSRQFLNELIEEIESIGYACSSYSHPVELTRNIDKHKKDLILSAWNGEHSPSRVSIIPAICESSSIRYVGADAASRIICNDKELSKSIARKLGFKVAKGLRLIRKEDFRLLDNLRLPVIVKPCNEGSSIGISRHSVCRSYSDIKRRTKLLWEKGFSHVYAEEFVIGREVCICIMGNAMGPSYAKCIEVTIDGNSEYLRENPYDAEIKKGRVGNRKLDILPDELLSSELKMAKRAFKYFAKVNLFRVDGRLNDKGEFIFIEFATQPTFGRASEVYIALSPFFPTYRDFIRALLRSEIKQSLDQDTNSLEL